MTEVDLLDYRVEACMLTDAGCHRANNEDSILYVKPNTDALMRAKGLLAIVADGMGGHQAGEVASRIAVETISSTYYRQKEKPLVSLKRALFEANSAIYTTAQKQSRLQGMGTTGTVLAIRKGKAYFVHVGDSRLYRLRAGGIEQMTEDDTMVNAMVKGGLLCSEEAKEHPDKNVITRAIGTHPHLEISPKGPFPIELDDRYVLCTDGLHDLVTEEEIRLAVATSPSSHAACQQLVSLAKTRGGYDNISIGILMILAPQAPMHEKLHATRFE